MAALPGSDFGLGNESLYTRIAFVDFDGQRALNAVGNDHLKDDAFVEVNCPKLVQACSRIADWLK